MSIGLGKESRRTYGFDEIALVPNGNTLDIELCDTSWQIGSFKMPTPILASAMDSVASPENASLIAEQGALAVINLQGLFTRYKDYDKALREICLASNDEFVPLMQKLYSEPVQDELISDLIKDLKESCPDKSKPVAVSIAPYLANKYYETIEAAGADIIVIQSTVVGLEHQTYKERQNYNPEAELNLAEFCKRSKLPVIVGNCVDYSVALKLIRTGISALLIGIGPGAACTSRGVLGIGVPMATSIADCRKAREDYFKETGEYVPIIADGGMSTGGDICKAIACGADAVMIGSPFARCKEAPGSGFHWGMATPSDVLPRGTRIQVGTHCSIKELLHGPAKKDDGTQNLVGALKTSMATLGAKNLKEMQNVEAVIAPSILTEGKLHQISQKLGMGR